MIAIYTRVSTEKQERKFSPAAQKEAGIAFARQQGQAYQIQSRLSRSVEDGAYLRTTFLAYKVRLFIDDVETDLSNLTNRLSHNIGNAISEYERDRITERLSRGAKSGESSGRVM